MTTELPNPLARDYAIAVVAALDTLRTILGATPPEITLRAMYADTASMISDLLSVVSSALAITDAVLLAAIPVGVASIPGVQNSVAAIICSLGYKPYTRQVMRVRCGAGELARSTSELCAAVAGLCAIIGRPNLAEDAGGRLLAYELHRVHSAISHGDNPIADSDAEVRRLCAECKNTAVAVSAFIARMPAPALRTPPSSQDIDEIDLGQ